MQKTHVHAEVEIIFNEYPTQQSGTDTSSEWNYLAGAAGAELVGN